MTVPSDVMLKLEGNKLAKRAASLKERQQKQQEKLVLYKQTHTPVEQLRAMNIKGAEGVDSIGEALGYGLASGIGQGVAGHMADLEEARLWLKNLREQANDAIQGQETEINKRDWFYQNKKGLQQITQLLPNLTPEQAIRAFTPFIEQLNNRTGNFEKLTDANTQTGVLTLQNADGELRQVYLYDFFPDEQTKTTTQLALKNAGLDISEPELNENQDEDIILHQAQKEYNEENNLAREKLNYQKLKEKHKMQLKKNDVFQGNEEMRILYREDMKSKIKEQEEWDTKILEAKQFEEKCIDFNKMLDELHGLKKKIGDSFLTNNNTAIVQKIREWVANGEPISTAVLKTLGIDDTTIENVQNYYQEINNILGQFYGKYGAEYMGKGARSDRDMEAFKANMIPAFFTPGKSFEKSLEHYKRITTNEISQSIDTYNSYTTKKIELSQMVRDPQLWIGKVG